MDSEIKSTRTTENMGHITPNQYSKSNLAHYNINKTAANNFVSIHPALGSQDRLVIKNRNYRLLVSSF